MREADACLMLKGGTILLIPVGIWLFKTGFRLVVPGV